MVTTSSTPFSITAVPSNSQHFLTIFLKIEASFRSQRTQIFLPSTALTFLQNVNSPRHKINSYDFSLTSKNFSLTISISVFHYSLSYYDWGF